MPGSSSDVDIRVLLRGAKAAAADAKLVSKSILGIGDDALKSSRKLSFLHAASDGVGRSFSNLGEAAKRSSFYLGGAFAVGAGVGIRAGLKFNAMLEQNTVAFTQFLGSGDKAKAFLHDLIQLAAHTPFETDTITDAARKLLAYGFSAKETMQQLRIGADAIAGAGLSPEKLDDYYRGIGQIRAKGKLMSEELNGQLGDLGIIDRKKLAKNLGITMGELADVGNQDISAKRAIRAINKTLGDSFGGSSEKQAKTFNGQLSTIRDNLNMLAGAITSPLFKTLRDNLFPGVNKAATEIQKTFARTDLTMDEKWRLARASLDKNVGPFVRDFVTEIKNAHLDEKLGQLIEWAIPKMADAGAKAAPKVAGAFVSAFNHSGAWGKLFIVGLIAKRLGVFGVLGSRAAEGFAGAFRRRKTKLGGPGGAGDGFSVNALGTAANPMWVRIMGKGVPEPTGTPTGGGGAGGEKEPKPSSKPGRGWRSRFGGEGRAGGRGAGALGFLASIGLGEAINHLPNGKIKDILVGQDVDAQGKELRRRTAALGNIYPNSTADRLRHPHRSVDPLGSNPFHVSVQIDGKEVAKAVSRATEKHRNRR